MIESIAEAQNHVEGNTIGTAVDLLKNKLPDLDKETQNALITVLSEARASQGRLQAELDEEISRRRLEATTGVSGTEDGKKAVQFISNLSAEKIARMIDDGTFTQQQVQIFARLAERHEEAFS